MENIIKKMIGDKKEYREQMARVAALPEDYQFVYEKIQSYLWSFASGFGMDMLKGNKLWTDAVRNRLNGKMNDRLEKDTGN